MRHRYRAFALVRLELVDACQSVDAGRCSQMFIVSLPLSRKWRLLAVRYVVRRNFAAL
jgi:hypothetical protein